MELQDYFEGKYRRFCEAFPGAHSPFEIFKEVLISGLSNRHLKVKLIEANPNSTENLRKELVRLAGVLDTTRRVMGLPKDPETVLKVGGGNQQGGQVLRCSYCGATGHRDTNCWTKHPQLRPQSMWGWASGSPLPSH